VRTDSKPPNAKRKPATWSYAGHPPTTPGTGWPGTRWKGHRNHQPSALQRMLIPVKAMFPPGIHPRLHHALSFLSDPARVLQTNLDDRRCSGRRRLAFAGPRRSQRQRTHLDRPHRRRRPAERRQRVGPRIVKPDDSVAGDFTRRNPAVSDSICHFSRTDPFTKSELYDDQRRIGNHYGAFLGSENRAISRFQGTNSSGVFQTQSFVVVRPKSAWAACSGQCYLFSLADSVTKKTLGCRCEIFKPFEKAGCSASCSLLLNYAAQTPPPS
jgi:hypothetical protein